jgi:hypothetical protein
VAVQEFPARRRDFMLKSSRLLTNRWFNVFVPSHSRAINQAAKDGVSAVDCGAESCFFRDHFHLRLTTTLANDSWPSCNRPGMIVVSNPQLVSWHFKSSSGILTCWQLTEATSSPVPSPKFGNFSFRGHDVDGQRHLVWRRGSA